MKMNEHGYHLLWSDLPIFLEIGSLRAPPHHLPSVQNYVAYNYFVKVKLYASFNGLTYITYC
jgi:hypothetical protein